MTEALIRCEGCGALVRDIPGKPYKYTGAPPGCWEVYTQVLAREYGEYGYPQPTHRLTVDTYAVQHPGTPGRQAIQSVNSHLVSLYLIVEKQLPGKAATEALRTILDHAGSFTWLQPPDPNGSNTVLEVARARTFNEHVGLVDAWARDVWSAWAQHHALISGLAAKCLHL
ncbi:MAG: DUF5946 family protein [Thermoanaerobaculales bacterium]